MVDVVGRAKVIVESQIDKASFDADGNKIGSTLKKGALVGVAALAGLATAGIKASIAFGEAEAIQNKLNNTLGNMGKSGASEYVNQFADNLSRLTGIDDEVIRGGQTVLATFSELAASAGEQGGNFDRATKAAADLSTVFGDVKSSAIQVGKALQDPVKGVSALGEAGVTFTEQQKALIQSLVDSGDILGAQDIILKEIEKQVGGNAEASASAADKIKNAFGELEESFGHLLSELTGGDITSLADGINALADSINEFADSETVDGVAFQTVGERLRNTTGIVVHVVVRVRTEVRCNVGRDAGHH
jgi:methyl-accepting chemotaxis protein